MKCNKDNDVLDSHFKSVVMSADEKNGSLDVMRSRGRPWLWTAVTSPTWTAVTPSRDGLRVTSAAANKNLIIVGHLVPDTNMAPLNVHVKHAGKKHDLELDTEKPPLAFKEAIYQLTGVPIDRMKVMVKGGVLKVRRHLTKRRKIDVYPSG